MGHAVAVLSPIVQRRSPNQSSRRGAAITHLVWHSTAGHYASAISWLCTPTTYNPDGSVKSGPDASAHLVIREDGGEVTQLVHLAAKAWHAEAWNGFTVGVEHASLGASFASSRQLLESARVFAWLCHTLGVPPVYGLHRPRGIVRHRDLGIAGGGHSDGPSDQVWFHEYLPAVQHECVRGGFRKTWALQTQTFGQVEPRPSSIVTAPLIGEYAAMTTYEFRLDYADGTYSVERVDADTLVAAYDAVRVGLPNGTSTMLLCMIDRTPQRALAFS